MIYSSKVIKLCKDKRSDEIVFGRSNKTVYERSDETMYEKNDETMYRKSDETMYGKSDETLYEKSDKTIEKVIRLHKDKRVISCVYVIKGGSGATPPAS